MSVLCFSRVVTDFSMLLHAISSSCSSRSKRRTLVKRKLPSKQCSLLNGLDTLFGQMCMLEMNNSDCLNMYNAYDNELVSYVRLRMQKKANYYEKLGLHDASEWSQILLYPLSCIHHARIIRLFGLGKVIITLSGVRSLDMPMYSELLSFLK